MKINKEFEQTIVISIKRLTTVENLKIKIS